ncbi:helix-turn-helix transcriptional regulator [Actinokineospora enzanensis]|uniref:helix-turn-helix transcriptional regulator n=1 Tax=Actinokineospora enzanensis TaxID=155975 RepID=UPI0003736540|nr:helix-turn-helix transcriptional regulator [Actinokineospora enzanensis]
MLFDREKELARAEDAVRAITARVGALAVISGPVGIGKTTLASAVADLGVRAGARVLRVAVSASERHYALGVVSQVWEAVVAGLTADERAQVLAGAADHVRPLFAAEVWPPNTDSPAPVGQELLHGLRHLFTVIGRRRPLVLVLDGLQWVDDESLRCLAYLANRLAGIGVLMVVTVHDGEADADTALVRHLTGLATHVLRPGPLSAASVAVLVREQFGEPGTDAFVATCHAVTRGNPMLLRFVLAELAAQGHRPTDDGIDAVHDCRPPALRDRLVRGLRGQPAQAIACLAAIGFLGDAAEAGLVEQLAGLDEIGRVEVLSSLTRQGLVVPEPRPALAHPVLREAIDELITADEVERLHAAAARLLHGTGHPAETVAEHLLAVPAQQEPWAVDALRCAADAAADRGAHALAARYLRRALLDTPPTSESRAALLLELAAIERATDSSASVRHVLEAASQLAAPRDQAAAIVQLPPTALGSPPFAVREVLHRVAAELGEPDGLGGVERELALRLEARTRHVDDGDSRWLADAVRRLGAVDTTRCLASPGGRELLAVLVRAAALTGTWASAEVARLGTAILDLEWPSPERLHATLPVVGALALADRPSAAAGWLDYALEQAVRGSDPVAAAVVHAAQGMALLASGHVGKAIAAGGSAAVPEAGQWLHAVSVSGVALETGPLDNCAEDLVGQVGAMCDGRTDYPPLMAVNQVARGIRAARRDDLGTALEHFLDCGRQLERAGWVNPAVFPWRAAVASLRHRLGNIAAARELAEEECALAITWGAPAAVGRALRLRGALTPGAVGLRFLREAVDVLDGSENVLEKSRAHMALGRRLSGSGDRDAEAHLRRGRGLAQACGAGWLLERQGAGRVRVDVPYASELTRAEFRVVQLVVGGRTNQAVADKLGISCRAVEKHLTSCYRKLKLAGRSELKAAFHTVPAAAEPGNN